MGYSSSGSPPNIAINQSIFMIKTTNSLGSIINTLTFTSISNSLMYVPIYLSPDFTKLHYEYIATGASSLTIVFKELNFDENSLTTI